MANSADPDQLASSEANWSGSTVCKTVQIQISWLLQKPTDLDLQFAKAGYIQVQQDKG